MSEENPNNQDKLARMRLLKSMSSLRGDLLSSQRVANMNNAKRRNSTDSSAFSSSNSSREVSPLPNRDININFNNCHIGNVQLSNSKIENTKTMIRDFAHNVAKLPNGRKWSLFAIILFSSIYAISPKCFYLINNSIITPCEKTIKNNINKYEQHVSSFNNISDVNKSISKYKNKYEMFDQKIEGILAVDAVSTEPVVKISQTGEVSGLLTTKKLTDEDIQKLKNEIRKQEEFIKNIKNETLSSAFVYYFQPLNPIFSCFVVFIEASQNGKASKKQIKTLQILEECLRSNDINVVAYASDGDSGYRPLVNETLSEFNKNNNECIINSSKTMYTNDPLHLLKRARYRFLTHNFTFLNSNERNFNFHPLIDILHIPAIVFDNSKITKMQDSFPLKLFTLENLKLLHNVGLYQHASYLLPFTLFNTALSYDSLLINERVELLEISFYFLNLYKILVTSHTSKLKAPQKSNKTAVVLFDGNLIDDMLATILTINTLLKTKTGIVSLNRMGTNPLEHHFGLLRINSKFKHNFENLIKQQRKIELLKSFEDELAINVVKKRQKSYGSILTLDKRKFSNSESIKIAQSLLQFYGVPVKKKIKKDVSDFLVGIFINKIEQFKETESSYSDKPILNSKDLKLNPSMGAYINKRQEAANIKSKSFDISSDDYADPRNIGDYGILETTSNSDDSSEDLDFEQNRKTLNKKKCKRCRSASQPIN